MRGGTHRNSFRAAYNGPCGADEAVFRREYGRCVATLIRFLGDIDAAEEAVQDAFAVAVGRPAAQSRRLDRHNRS